MQILIKIVIDSQKKKKKIKNKGERKKLKKN